MPDDMFAYAEGASARGPARDHRRRRRRGATCPAWLAAKTTVPVLGVPVASRQPAGGRLAGIPSCRCPRASRSPRSRSVHAGAANAALFRRVAMLATEQPALRTPARGLSPGADRSGARNVGPI